MHTHTPYALRAVGTHTGTVAVLVAAVPVGTVYPLRLPGQVPGVVAWCAYCRGTYCGHERSRAAAVRAVAYAHEQGRVAA